MTTRFVARDLWRAPALLSWSRLGFAIVFPVVATQPVAALTVLVLGGVSDVLDGWRARLPQPPAPTLRES